MDGNRTNKIDGFERTRPKAFDPNEVIELSSEDEFDLPPRNQYYTEQPIKTETIETNQRNELNNFEDFTTMTEIDEPNTQPNLIEPNSSLGALNSYFDEGNDSETDFDLLLDFFPTKEHKQTKAASSTPRVQHSVNTGDLKRKFDTTPPALYQQSTPNERSIQYSTASTSCNSSLINETAKDEQSFRLQNSFKDDSFKGNTMQQMFQESFQEMQQQQAKQQKLDTASQQYFTEPFDQHSRSGNFENGTPHSIPNNNPPQLRPVNTNDTNDDAAQKFFLAFKETYKNMFGGNVVLMREEEVNQLKKGHHNSTEREQSSSKHRRRHHDHGRSGHSSHSHRSSANKHRSSGSSKHRSSRPSKHSAPLKVNKVEKVEKMMPTSSTSTVTSIGYQTLDEDVSPNYNEPSSTDSDDPTDSDFEPNPKKSIFHTFLTSGKLFVLSFARKNNLALMTSLFFFA